MLTGRAPRSAKIVWTLPSDAVRTVIFRTSFGRGDSDDPREVTSVGGEVAVSRMDHVTGVKTGPLGRATGKHPGDLDSPDTIRLNVWLFFDSE